MSVKYQKLKIVVCSVVMWNDVQNRYMWWTVIRIGERWMRVGG